ncbi:shikimate dehydrogenase [Romboutsia maritimum]|uniref:Shikimate dehydrogenase (NADP(+)) n=1 Tax=Romboutsia maritimum TaxID=2020948 RepID=A0A371IWF2_9FIRM|nr:shikimate dehydrogenase [Romboutsia maritimum]RDY24816.1 shikimate dehydrogenase [Romboutsia maritimum]
MNINSNTTTICLLGHPVKQSFSPNIQNYLFEKYNVNSIYSCFDVDKDRLEDAIKGIKSLGIGGCNITIPYKVDVIKYLDKVDMSAGLIGAVNTLKNEGGELKGYNTDGVGFVKSILDKGYEVKNKRVAVLGAGGACRSIAIELANNGVYSIEIRNRTINKAIEIKDIIKKHFSTEISCSTEPINQEDLNNIDILINTTPIGMNSDECPIDEKIKTNDTLVCDIVYKPHNTKFLNWAIKQNLDVVHGIDMLINQGLHAFYIWTNIKPSKKDAQILKEMYLKIVKQ